MVSSVVLLELRSGHPKSGRRSFVRVSSGLVEAAARHLLYRHLLFATLAIQTFAIRDICYRTKIPKKSEKFQKNQKMSRIANVAYSKCPIANVA